MAEKLTLREARCGFTKAFSELVLFANSQPGYGVAMDETTVNITPKQPTGNHMKNSCHYCGLAGDLLLYKDGVWQTETEQYKFLGVWWEAKGKAEGTPLAWGGRFSDGNHFSWAWQGRK